jgi:hypothetical protein
MFLAPDRNQGQALAFILESSPQDLHMIEQDAYRRAFDAENEGLAANARADAAVASRDAARASVARLETEISIAAAIAVEVFSMLAKRDLMSASCVSESVRSHYAKYCDSREFPNIADLLTRIGARHGVPSREPVRE